jgi:hypothetical protein
MRFQRITSVDEDNIADPNVETVVQELNKDIV